MDELTGRAVIVTGAGRGLGRAYALSAASHGAHVVVNDVDADEAAYVAREIATAGGTARASGHDVSDSLQAAALIAQGIESFGRLDGLVNNAGLLEFGPPGDDDPELVRRLVEVNVLGPLYCGSAAIRWMRDHGGGSIVNVTSGAHLGMTSLAAYGASKGAVASLTYAWALDCGAHGIRVNAVSPTAATRMTDRFGVDRATQQTPVQVAPLVTYLLSDASAPLTGQIFRMDHLALSRLAPARFGDPTAPRDAWEIAEVAAMVRSGQLGPDEPFGYSG
jgi:NAD(P)-dependent dehydrogenase (short-subunit alcohol dehydrogenase family)